MSNNNSDLIKQQTDFLKHDSNVKYDYLLLKSGRNVFNLPKHQIYNTTHNPILNFFINPKNNYSSKPFGSNSNTYIDFELPLINYTYHQFVFRFKILNTSSAVFTVMPGPFMIDRVSILKNSNTFGVDVDSVDILHYNINKYFNEIEIGRNISSMYANTGLVLGSGVLNGNFISILYLAGGSKQYNIELPVSLNRSNMPACLIKENLVLRVYFKNDVAYDGNPSDLVLSDVGLVLRMEELNNNQLTHLYKQPKFNHMFNKRIVLRYPINRLDAGVEVSVNMAGFRNVAGGLLCFISYPLNDIKLKSLLQYHIYLFGMDNVYIVDGTGKNISNNNKLDKNWNNYLIPSKFGSFGEALNALSLSPDALLENNGKIYYIPHSSDGSDAFNGVFSGGYSYKSTSDHVFKFTPDSTYNGNVILNIIAFVPSLLSLSDGILTEEYA